MSDLNLIHIQIGSIAAGESISLLGAGPGLGIYAPDGSPITIVGAQLCGRVLAANAAATLDLTLESSRGGDISDPIVSHDCSATGLFRDPHTALPGGSFGPDLSMKLTCTDAGVTAVCTEVKVTLWIRLGAPTALRA